MKNGVTVRNVILCIIIVATVFTFGGCAEDNGKVIEEPPFYSLQAAYNNKYIRKADLKKISAMLDSKDDAALGDEKIAEIKEAYAARYPVDGKSASDVTVVRCLGVYRGSVALKIAYEDTEAATVAWSETVGGVKVHYNDGWRIVIYKKS